MEKVRLNDKREGVQWIWMWETWPVVSVDDSLLKKGSASTLAVRGQYNAEQKKILLPTQKTWGLISSKHF